MKTQMNVLVAVAGVLLASPQLIAQPRILTQPGDLTVSLNATIEFRCVGQSSGGPVTCRWRFKDIELDPALNPSAVKTTLRLSNVTEAMAGTYWAVLTDANGAVTSRVAKLTADPTFTKVTDQPLTKQAKAWMGCNWGDYDGDGLLDLFVACTWAQYGEVVTNALYHNEGGGRFSQVINNVVATRRGYCWNGAWADYDNDRRLDLFVPRESNWETAFYHNQDDGAFEERRVDRLGRFDLAWGDFDQDGWVDLFLPGTAGDPASRVPSCIYRNRGNGTFARITLKSIGLDFPEPATAVGCRWLDFNNDGRQDLAISVVREGHEVWEHLLFQRTPEGPYRQVQSGSLGQAVVVTCSWGDYDNDGYLDALSTPLAGPGPADAEIALHHNLQGATFANASEDAGLLPMKGANTACWGDYDNDGWLDFFVCHFAATNALFHNNRDGTFAAVDVGSPLRDESQHWCAAWADYDNDGYLDLFMVNGYGDATRNCLYRNNGGANAWLKVKLVGGAPSPGHSNRDGIGAKVRVSATLRGQPVTQMRDIASASAWSTPQGLVAHFGLADAKKADRVRIEWPSGVVQELKDVAANQFLTVWEPPGLEATVLVDGSVHLAIGAEPNRAWRIEASTDLRTWQTIMTMISPTPQFQYTDPDAAGMPFRFYRLVSAP